MNYQLVFRSPFGQVTAVVMAVVAVVFMGLIWRADGFLPMLASAPLPIGLAYFSWWIWGWPAVVVDARGVLIRNQLRTYRIGWGAFTKAESRFGLYIYVSNDEGEQSAVDRSAGQNSEASSSPGATSVLAPPPTPDLPAHAPTAARPDLPTVRGELTIGDVDPITLDPGGLALRKPIYAAGVPARGGLKTATQKEMPQVPALDLRARNRVVLRVTPMVAARILDEEKYYLDHPSERPELHSSKEPFVTTSTYGGLRITTNWLQISGLVAFFAYWAWMLL